ncbi:MAG TPA: L,D-transpeptidase [Polyangiaceae bacterium]|nr:L,D-transpeptidase [Polyangiaceae bacterium]
MANFLKPPGVDLGGYDSALNKQTVTPQHYATVALWGAGPHGETLSVALNDASVGSVVEHARQKNLRIFRVTGKKIGVAMLEAKLKDGRVWAFMQIEVVASRGKRIVVHLENQNVEAFDGGALIYQFDCVTGDESHPTEPGTFKVFKKLHPHRSAKYDAQMNYALFFSVDGKALHQYHGVLPLSAVRFMKSKVSDRLGSHGCVRLTEDDAKALYSWTPIGTLVEVKAK